jgi:hypothetical protein
MTVSHGRDRLQSTCDFQTADGFREGLNRSRCLLICRHGKSNPGMALRQINATGKSLLIIRNHVKPRNQKYFCFRLTQIRCISKPSRPTRGAIARRHERGAGCGGRGGAFDEWR